ncbi:MAG: Mur ligase family protein, partial [Acidobacteriota bacterium]
MKRELEINGKDILVVGLARSGVAAARFLSERGARVTVTDSKPPAQLQKEICALPQSVRLALGGHEMDDFTSADFIVLSPGVPARLPQIQQARKRGVPVYAELELAYRFLQGRIIGITGSNGKTTTTALIGRLFEDSGRPHIVAGNIGVPLIQFVGWGQV